MTEWWNDWAHWLPTPSSKSIHFHFCDIIRSRFMHTDRSLYSFLRQFPHLFPYFHILHMFIYLWNWSYVVLNTHIYQILFFLNMFISDHKFTINCCALPFQSVPTPVIIHLDQIQKEVNTYPIIAFSSLSETTFDLSQPFTETIAMMTLQLSRNPIVTEQRLAFLFGDGDKCDICRQFNYIPYWKCHPIKRTLK